MGFIYNAHLGCIHTARMGFIYHARMGPSPTPATSTSTAAPPFHVRLCSPPTPPFSSMTSALFLLGILRQGPPPTSFAPRSLPLYGRSPLSDGTVPPGLPRSTLGPPRRYALGPSRLGPFTACCSRA
ncbi:hypothetical protein V8E36_005663 [Tilletia maclaganii]